MTDTPTPKNKIPSLVVFQSFANSGDAEKFISTLANDERGKQWFILSVPTVPAQSPFDLAPRPHVCVVANREGLERAAGWKNDPAN